MARSSMRRGRPGRGKRRARPQFGGPRGARGRRLHRAGNAGGGFGGAMTGADIPDIPAEAKSWRHFVTRNGDNNSGRADILLCKENKPGPDCIVLNKFQQKIISNGKANIYKG